MFVRLKLTDKLSEARVYDYTYIQQLFPEIYDTMEKMDVNDLRRLPVAMETTPDNISLSELELPTKLTMDSPVKEILVRYEMPYAHQGSSQDIEGVPDSVSVYVTQGTNIYRKKTYTKETFHLGGLEIELLEAEKSGWEGWISEDPYA